MLTRFRLDGGWWDGVLLDVRTDRRELQGAALAQGPDERPAADRDLEAPRVEVQPGTSAGEPPTRVRDGSTLGAGPGRDDAQQP